MNSTIVAPMTPSGVSAIAAIRVSGKAVRSILSEALLNTDPKPRHAYYGDFRHLQTKKILDSLLYIFFEAKHSYTGEDVLELYPHGNPLIVKGIIQSLTHLDSLRLANPGEFTQRAFLNGKLDLVQAESVADVIHSNTLEAIHNAQRLLKGTLSSTIQELAESIKNMSMRLELDVDFVEEEVDPDPHSWKPTLLQIQRHLDRLIQEFQSAESTNRLPLVVVYGKPNAGKSSLINALIQEDRLLVSDRPGTTRDFVEVRLLLEGGEIRLIDTAGIATEVADDLDALSMQKSLEILKEADLKVCLIDGAKNQDITDDIQAAKKEKAFPIVSKADLLEKNNDSILHSQSLSFVSTKQDTESYIHQLKSKWNKILFPAKENQEDFWVTSERQKTSLIAAQKGIEKTLDLIETNPAVELLAFEMQLVRQELLAITGQISSEDILQSIFSRFCVGK